MPPGLLSRRVPSDDRWGLLLDQTRWGIETAIAGTLEAQAFDYGLRESERLPLT